MIAGVLKVPLIGSLVSFATSKFRLFIEYLLIALIVILAATAASLWYHVKGLEQTNRDYRDRVTRNEQLNDSQEQTIAALQSARSKDAELTQKLMTEYAKLSKWDVNARRKLHELEKRNEAVRNYLDTALPDDLARMLNAAEGARAEGNNKNGKAAAARDPAR